MNPLLKRIIKLEGKTGRTPGGKLSYAIIPHKDGAQRNDEASCNGIKVIRETGESVNDFLAHVNVAFQFESGCVIYLLNR